MKKSICTVFCLLLILSSISGILPIIGAQQSIDRTVDTTAYLSVNPNPIGVGQFVSASIWIEPIQPIDNFFHGLTVTITKPDGTNETKGPFTASSLATYHFSYMPTVIGNYTFVFNYPGEKFADTNDTYLPSQTPCTTLIVQEKQVTALPLNPLPSAYWTRPINTQDTNWYTISGNWLMMGYNSTNTGYGDSYGGFNPYTDAPLSAHIMWTKGLDLGGLPGGDVNTSSYYTGQYYHPYLSPPIIIGGELIYRTQRSDATSAHPACPGFVCVDLRTGQELWRNDTGNVDFAQLWNYQIGDGDEGIVSYLYGNTLTSNWDVYNPYTGRWIFGYNNAYATNQWVWWPDAAMSTSDGTICVYMLDGSNNWLAMWNSTKAFTANRINWRDPTPKYYDWMKGIEWNVTIPDHRVNSTTTDSTALTLVGPTRQGISGNVLLAKVTDGALKVYYEIGYDLNTGKELWVHGQDDSVQSFFTVMGDGIYASFDLATSKWTGYDLDTGKKLWVSDSNEYPWGSYINYSPVIAYDTLYSGSFDGYLHAFNITTGDQMWKFSSGNAGLETSFGTWPIWGGTIVGGDVVYTSTGGETPSKPFTNGQRLFAVNATTGQGIWNISGFMSVRALADGYLVAFNGYDSNIYCFGKGPSQTTVTAPSVGVTTATPITISGTVMDIASGASQSGIDVRFPNGLPCVSDDSQSEWMSYVYQQQTKPTSTTGVPVILSVVDSNGNYRIIGVTTTKDGTYAYTWTPDIAGDYQVIATFAGTDSYYSSDAIAYFHASDVPTSTPQPTQAPFAADLYFLPAIAGLFVAIIVCIAMVALVLMKKP